MTERTGERTGRRAKLSSRVEEQLIALLQSGEWLPDDVLPSERELMTLHGVGRPAIREALQRLELMGLVEIRHGGRARVALPTVDRMFAQLSQTVHHVLSHSKGSLTYLLELREIVEMEMARKAAEMRSPALVDRIRLAIQAQEAALGSSKQFMDLDGQFHIEIAKGSENPIAVEMVRAIFSWLRDFHSHWVRRPGLGALTISEHKSILRAIEDGDPENAALTMKTHLNRSGSQYSTGNGRLTATAAAGGPSDGVPRP